MNLARDVNRILREFARDHSFELAWSTRAGDLGITRRSSQEGLFEQVWLTFAGAGKDAVTTYAAVSVVGGRGTKGLVELEVVRELATAEGRGYASIGSPAELSAWAAGLGAIMPARVKQLAQQVGPALLERTQTARQETKAWAQLIPPSARLHEIKAWAMSRLSGESQEAALRLADLPGVIVDEDERELYEVGALVITAAGADFPEAARLLNSNLLTEPEAMWRLQLLVDHLRTRVPREDRQHRSLQVSR